MYDLIIEVLHTVWRNGIGLTALGTVVFVLLKQRKVKKRLQRYIPWLLEDESETRHYVENQRRIETKVDLLLRERGITWVVPTSEMSNDSTRGHRTSYTSSSVEVSAARDVARRGVWSYTKSIIRRMRQLNKFKSRKFWMAVISALLVVANEGLDLGISSETVMTFAALVATFILGESAVDAKRAGSREEIPGDTGPAE